MIELRDGTRSEGEDLEMMTTTARDADNAPTIAQWARAQALMAILSGPTDGQPSSVTGVADMVNVYAELIVTGSLPKPPPGVFW